MLTGPWPCLALVPESGWGQRHHRLGGEGASTPSRLPLLPRLIKAACPSPAQGEDVGSADLLPFGKFWNDFLCSRA